MKKNMFSIFMAMLIFAGVLTGCTGSKTTETKSSSQPSTSAESNEQGDSSQIDTSKELKLKMYLLGDKAADFDEVYAEINKTLKEKVNATVDVEFLSWAEHETKYSLLFSSGEDFDLIFTASGWAHYETTATKKGFLDLTPDLLNRYAPDIMKIMPQDAWDQAKVGGSVFMVPNYNIEFAYELFGVRGDLMEKHGIEKIESKADLEKYFEAVAADEEAISPLGTKGGELAYPYLLKSNGYDLLKGSPIPLFAYDVNKPEDPKVISIAETDEFREYARTMKQMVDKGYWSKDSLSANDTRSDPWMLGKSAVMVWNIGSVVTYAVQMNKEHPEWKATMVDISPRMKRTISPYTNNGVAINAMSKNPERALMVLNEFMTNKTVYDLASLGIEGKHYTAVGDDKYTPLEGASGFPANTSCNWGWNNENLKRKLYEENPDPIIQKSEETLEHWKKDLIAVHPLTAFAYSEENVKSEAAVINTIIEQYYNPISVGIVADSDKAVDEFIAKLKEAGIDKVVADMQSKVDEYVAGK